MNAEADQRDTDEAGVSEQALRWRPSELAVRLAVTAATALAVAVLARLPELLAFAAPLLGALTIGALHQRSSTITVRADPDSARCFEDETVSMRLTATAPDGCEHIEARITSGNGVEVVEEELASTGTETSARWELRTPAWGRFAPAVLITARAAGGLLVADLKVYPMRVRVYPRPAPQSAPVRSADLPDRIGTHIARRRGEGVEFAGIRPYVAGDQLRMVNWAASARRGRLHVTERLAERSADVVAVIDTYTGVDAGAAGEESAGQSSSGPAREAMDLAAHGAAQVVQAALRRGDRAGVVALGGQARWLTPDVGRRQFYRVVDAVLDAYPTPADADRRSVSHTDLVPRGLLPTGAILVAFSPLVDGRIALALNDVRLRGYAVLVVDVLRDIPYGGPDRLDPLVTRLWRLGRGSMYRNFAVLGIPVVPWSRDTALDEVLAPLARKPLVVRRPAL